jgi:hypothetical protein
MSERICTRSLASRFDNGSSIRKTSGLRTIARPIATRWRCPPDSIRGRRSSKSCRPSVAADRSTRRWISSFGILRNFNPNEMLSSTLMWG